MGGTPDPDEVQRLLDDPNVSEETKDRLRATQAMTWFDDDGDADTELDKAYDEARFESEKGKYPESVSNGRAALEDSQRKADNGDYGGAGAKFGDELLDAGKPGLRCFENWVPLYQKIQYDYNDKSKVQSVDQIRERYSEQRDLAFDKFAENIAELQAAERGMRESLQIMADKLGRLWTDWTGSASEASQEFFSQTFTPTAQERVVATVNDAASMTEDTVKAVAEMIRNKASTVLGLDQSAYQIGGKSRSDWDVTIQVANGTDDSGLWMTAATIWDMEGFGQSEPFFWLDQLPEMRERVVAHCRTVVRQTFAKSVEDLCTEFTTLCDETKRQIDEAWGNLNSELGKAEENPFANPAGNGKDGSDNDRQRGGPDGRTASGGGGAGSGSSTGSGGGGMSTPPEMPEVPEAPSDTPKPPETPEEPGTLGGGAGDPQRVTIGAGADAVTIQEPGQTGKTQVEVIGPDGRPRTYEIDFGSEREPRAGPVQPGVAGHDDIPTAPAPGQQSIPVQPGPDGRAVIHEGERTITLERTPEGEIKISVDNGDGRPPTDQAIHFGDAAEPTTARASSEVGAVPTSPPGPSADPMPGPDPRAVGTTPAYNTTPTPIAAHTAGTFTTLDEGARNSFGSASGQLFGTDGGMAGGMGAMGGAAQQQGGDQGRTNSSPWRTQGRLFEDDVAPSNVWSRSVLDEHRDL
jgi:hypothetical protein